ncbi:MAG: UDP-N-acetylglucosamine 2-epimerase (non-hydrolyzing) [Anaerolineales bacterium]|nr:UDP-N-acetylglucosamine 2-epimerase (non-hydrolyzing) [Anaerolineales bacterium]MCS7247548.1 UDP-N-acetylglucosamine 2-epimerase (non-hydrolyzing) [Anaerolineales bacterium]MDW8161359.1 UDP-N-acetylglucosamine 2-epimerase (non-hydrolyzing) [Anaerolineales bacterium]MDW8447084.1 UDP-N-acetylglucosamine 2-epimerase (non-hydrolyzing) [Anaerolineales bacterium]
MKLRVLSVLGTRPEAVKMAPVVRELAAQREVESLVCVTAQHREMLDQVLGLFDIRPDIDLNLMRPNQSLAELTAAIFTHLDPVLSQLKPDWILVQGDTTTVMATALLSYYHRIRIGHVEAGLRSGDKWQPFPEEINRSVVGVVADLHFAPTEWARQNLLRENVAPERILVTGNPVIDALQHVANLPLSPEAEAFFRHYRLPPYHPPEQSHLILVTAHRRENFGKPLENICRALRALASEYGESLRIVYPVHLNPNVWEPVYRWLGDIPNITLLPPMDYLPFVHLMKNATLILTDSGGLQEEAPGLGKPVLVLRQVTERPEGVQAGTVRLVGTDAEIIVAETRRLLNDPEAYRAMAQAVNPYGDGRAAQRIVQAILERARS